MLFPDGTRSKLAAWAHNQLPNGMLAEQIFEQNPDTYQNTRCDACPSERRMACGSTRKRRTPSLDRNMSDVSSMFILYVLELLRWDADNVTATLYYPTVKRAAQWQMRNASRFGVPTHLQTSYDIMGFDKSEVAVYASVFHLAAMAAAAELATFAGDASFADECRAALERGRSAIDQLQWSVEGRHYWAASSNCTAGAGCDASSGVFADSFYAQVLVYSVAGEELLADPTRLDQHLETEARTNCVHTDLSGGNGSTDVLAPGCPNGLVGITGRPVQGTDLMVWAMTNYNHATLLVRRSDGGMRAGATSPQVGRALALAQAAGTSYTERVRDQWNVAGIQSNDGYPCLTSHCGPPRSLSNRSPLRPSDLRP